MYKLLDHVIDLICRRDFEYAELQGGVIAVLWGVWLLNPWVQVFADDAWSRIAVIAPEHAWGGALVVIGLCQLVALLKQSYRWRRVGAISAAAVWLALGVLLALARPYRLGVPSAWMFFVGASWGYLRIGMSKHEG
jgi:hypothetical protein